jgi:hypothetical protein
VLPTGIATDDTTKFFFQDLVEKRSLVSLFDFENRNGIFPDVHRSYKFCLLTIGHGLFPSASAAQFVFFALAVEDLKDTEKHFTLSVEDIALLNPSTRTCPIFRSKRDAELNKAVYQRTSTLCASNIDSWNAYYMRLVDMEDHAEDIRFPWQDKGSEWNTVLYESKLIHSFDHRFATFKGVAQADFAAGQARNTTILEKQNPEFFCHAALSGSRFSRQRVICKIFRPQTRMVVGVARRCEGD